MERLAVISPSVSLRYDSISPKQVVHMSDIQAYTPSVQRSLPLISLALRTARNCIHWPEYGSKQTNSSWCSTHLRFDQREQAKLPISWSPLKEVYLHILKKNYPVSLCWITRSIYAEMSSILNIKKSLIDSYTLLLYCLHNFTMMGYCIILWNLSSWF